MKAFKELLTCILLLLFAWTNEKALTNSPKLTSLFDFREKLEPSIVNFYILG